MLGPWLWMGLVLCPGTLPDVPYGGDLPHKSHLLPLSALVFMSQIVVYTVRLNLPLHMYIENEVTGFQYVALKVLL